MNERSHLRTEGGDPVCWLDRVCRDCGAMLDEPLAATCWRCGAEVQRDD